jgi:hypothetical protein
VATLAHAMSLAAMCPDLCDIVVSAGTYQKTITLTSGISIYGGYVPKTFVYDLAANVTIIDGTEDRAVIAQGLTLSTLLSGFTIKGKSFAGEGKSTYAVWVKDVADDLLQIDKCTIQAGAAGVGVDGADGTKGADGGLGGAANGSNGGTGGASSCGATGGTGGSAGDCFSEPGGNGPGRRRPDRGRHGRHRGQERVQRQHHHRLQRQGRRGPGGPGRWRR